MNEVADGLKFSKQLRPRLVHLGFLLRRQLFVILRALDHPRRIAAGLPPFQHQWASAELK